MKSTTSFFDSTLLKKNLARFWPLWAAYGLIWAYALPIRCLMLMSRNQYMGDGVVERVKYFAQSVPSMLGGAGLVMAAVFGILAAMAMFSYLFNARSACMIHALPIRREGLFFTNYLSGLICLLGPNAVVWLVTLAAEALGGHLEAGPVTVWLLGQSGMCLFFYSFAVFCAMFTGHLLALPIFYGILNILAAVLMWLINTLLQSFWYGFGGLSERTVRAVYWLVPVIRLDGLYWSYNSELGKGWLEDGWVIAVYAAVGVVLAALALSVYLRRHVESAGDVVAVPVVRPIFKYGVAVCSALCFGFVLVEMMGWEGPLALTVNLVFWGAAGYFVAEMLLRKSFRVLDAWKGCAVLAAIIVAVSIGLHMDMFGVALRIPKADSVASIHLNGLYTAPFDGARHVFVGTDDPETIQKVLEVHQAILDQFQSMDDHTFYDDNNYLDVTYYLKNGADMSRSYHVYLIKGSKLVGLLQDLVNDPALVRAAYGLDDVIPERLGYVNLIDLWDEETGGTVDLWADSLDVLTNKAALQKLYAAVLRDFEEGNLGRRYLFDDDPERYANTCVTDLELYWEQESIMGQNGMTYTPGRSITITITPQARHTIQALTEMGVLTESRTLFLWVDQKLG